MFYHYYLDLPFNFISMMHFQIIMILLSSVFSIHISLHCTVEYIIATCWKCSLIYNFWLDWFSKFSVSHVSFHCVITLFFLHVVLCVTFWGVCLIGCSWWRNYLTIDFFLFFPFSNSWQYLVNVRFIKTYGTHIIVEMAIGGQDVICVKQSHSSTVSAADLKLHMEDLGDFLFSGMKNHSPIHRKTKDGKSKV